jgi:hypothetical protein
MICLILQKLAWIKQGKLDSSSFEVEHVRKQIEELQEQIDQRYTLHQNDKDVAFIDRSKK